MINNFSKESFNFRDTKKCNNILKKPVRVHPCGHTFCQECSPRPGHQCFNCITEVIKSQPDLTARGLIDDLIVKCTAPGCPFTGSYQLYKRSHQQNCVIGRSGGLQNWMQNMKYAIDNIKYQTVKQADLQSQNIIFSQQDEGLQQMQDKNERVITNKKDREDQKFIECISVQGKNIQQMDCRELDGVERFTQIYFNNNSKSRQTKQKKDKRVIELL